MHNNPNLRSTHAWRLPLAAALLAVSFAAPAFATPAAAKAQPQLLEAARATPDQMVAVIVQKSEKSALAESMVSTLGGRVTTQLGIINAFVAQLPARAVPTLARSSAVRWISLDAPMVNSSWRGDGNQPEQTGAYQVAIGDAAAAAPQNNGELGTMALQAQPVVQVGKDGASVVVPALPADAGQMSASGEIVPAKPLSDAQPTLLLNPNNKRHANGFSTNYVDPASLRNVYQGTVRATNAWQAGYTGSGVGVAVLDSGTTGGLEDFSDTYGQTRVKASVRFDVDADAALSATVSLTDAAQLAQDDVFGHGTHVAGIVAGAGQKKDNKGYAGTAPNAELLNVHVINADGSARASSVVAGMQWILENKARYNIRVVNISMNSAEYESYHTNPLCAAAEVLWFNGIVVVVSAGNRGGGNLFPPANDPFVITVGATDDKGTSTRGDDTLASFSAYGVADGFAKPDLVAPGRMIVAPMTDAKLKKDGRAKAVGKDYAAMSGTSMAAPVVAGAVAMLLEKEPWLTPDQVKYRLKASATPFLTTAVAGAGLLDVYNALTTYTWASANTGTPMSRLLTGGGSTNWASVSWSSVSWSSVSWSSVSWSSVSWSSDYVEP